MDLRNGESGGPERRHDGKLVENTLLIYTLPGRGASNRRYEADPLVIAQRVVSEPTTPNDFTD